MIGVSLPILIFLVFMGVISYCNYSNEIDFDIKSATIKKENTYTVYILKMTVWGILITLN